MRSQKAGERVKTNRRDCLTLAKLLRAEELTAVWVPDVAHEAMRDLCRARQMAMQGLRRARQQVLGFLLRQGWAKLDFGDVEELAQLKKLHQVGGSAIRDAPSAIGPQRLSTIPEN